MLMKAATLAIALMVSGAAVAQDIDLFAMADSNHDDKVSPAENAAFREQGWGYFFNGQESADATQNPAAAPLLAGVAPDTTGKVAHTAFTAAAPTVFKQADKNGDGSLSRAEFDAVMPPPGG